MLKKSIIVAISFLVLAVMSVPILAGLHHETPAGITANLTGRDVQSIIDEKVETGKTYGKIASEAGKLDGFKAEALEMKKNRLAERVKAGEISQSEADELLRIIKEKQAMCDGTGSSNGAECHLGLGFGTNSVKGHHQGASGHHAGLRHRDGSCSNK
jgi:polyhydroxyalkanoate synthesis regulator phasin